MNDYQIFTDATADLTHELIDGLPEAKVLQMEILMDGKSYTYGPQGNIDHDLFYSLLSPSIDIKTSSINPEEYLNAFEEVLKQGKDVLYLCFTSGLSGTYNTAAFICRDLKERYPDRKIYCVDTLCASIGEAFFVYEALKRQKEGYSVDELYEWCSYNRRRVAHWFTLDDFDYLIKGGRISPAAAAIGAALQIKPLLSVDEDGKLYVPAKLRGRKSSIATLLKKVDTDWKKDVDTKIIVGHGNCPQEAQEMKEKILARHPEADVTVMTIGPVIGSHTGPSILAVVFYQ